MRCSPSSTVDIKLPSSFLSFYQRRSRRLPKHRFEMAMLALLKTSDHHAMCSPLFQKTPTMSEHVQGSSSLAMHIKSPPLTLLSSQTFLFLSTKKHTPTPMPALLKSTWNKDMFFSLSETTSADLYAQGASGLVIHIQLAPGTLLSWLPATLLLPELHSHATMFTLSKNPDFTSSFFDLKKRSVVLLHADLWFEDIKSPWSSEWLRLTTIPPLLT